MNCELLLVTEHVILCVISQHLTTQEAGLVIVHKYGDTDYVSVFTRERTYYYYSTVHSM